MNYIIRPVVARDMDFLWDMLFYAAHMAEDGATSSEAARQDPFLALYVDGWGRAGDVGCVAVDAGTGERLGAAWVRVLHDDMPELAIAVLPAAIGQGIGTALIRHVLEAARADHAAIMLTVRVDNPAARLYERLGFTIVEQITNRVGSMSHKMVFRYEREPATLAT
ncbi:MAG TPA: GNAT family N-acetyltransferase [Roseiflexaceae bacterium]|nr:GNAT family N-acetyltransferase [Roseiflexaceae bacterium]